MTGLAVQTGAWMIAMLGLYATIYTIMKWRRAAQACHPMPFRRRKGYMTGLVFSALCLTTPVLAQINADQAELIVVTPAEI